MLKAVFCEEEGAVAGDVVEALEVTFEFGLLFQVNVEGCEVGVAWFEVFGGGEVGVGVEKIGGVLAAFGDEIFEDFAHFGGSHEANEVGADFVGDEKSREGGMVAVAREIEGEVALGVADGVGVFGEEGVGIPRDDGENEELVFLGEIELLSARGVVKANGVEAGGCDAGEFYSGIELLVRREGAVGNGVEEAGSSLILKESSVDCECHQIRA